MPMPKLKAKEGVWVWVRVCPFNWYDGAIHLFDILFYSSSVGIMQFLKTKRNIKYKKNKFSSAFTPVWNLMLEVLEAWGQ